MPPMYATQIRQPDIAAALTAAENIKSNRLRNKLAERKMSLAEQKAGRETRVNQLAGSYLSGDKEAGQNLAQTDPEMYMKVQEFNRTATEEQRAKAKENAQFTGRMAQSLMNMNEMQRAQAYPQVLQSLQRRGVDVSNWPQEWSPELMPRLQVARAEAMTMEQHLGPEPTAAQRNVEAAMGYPEGDPRRESLLNTGKTSITFEAQDKMRGELGKQVGKRYGDLEKEASSASENIARTQQLKTLLANPDVYQGTGGEAIAALKKFGKTFAGMGFEGVEDAEVAGKISQEMALEATSKLPGQISNKELDFIKELPPGLHKSAAANQLLADLNILGDELAVARRDAAQKALMDPKARPVDVMQAISEVEEQYVAEARGKLDQLRTMAENVEQPSPTAGFDEETKRFIEMYAD